LTGYLSETCINATAYFDIENLQAIVESVAVFTGAPWVWGNYTVIIMPAVFPMNGMENPLLSMISSTFITGTQSQQFVLAHFVAH
jgi:hypothetical protein